MLMLAYASVPLYRLFCQVTGFGGTPQVVAKTEQGQVSDVVVTVRFNADIDPGLNWEFAPGERVVKMKIGEHRLTYFTAKNLDAVATAGHATFNVLPESAGAYFSKMECFCFTDQRLSAGQRATLPVSFYIDPAILEDPLLKDTRIITLSYTFFPSKSGSVTSNP